MRDSQGQWVSGFHAFQDGGSALLSEVLALKTGLQLVWNKGYRNIVCNTDCRELLVSLEDEEIRRFFPILKEIRAILRRQWKVALTGFSKESSKPAD